ncbi:hypothetical protein G6F29_013090 [Rhizopus arrhizus]|uniref:Uncharacterized protein n=1 Tax=Rhizopus oryzae TaxID=64495 RepID=A0A9P6WW64_RHIOR|nr:hypothetical protein G6F30_013116 [Rhizopus arrhizus]KAG1393861.1 hypothetical protein G6F58_012229 [Rhizopus delemar]KAG0973035.1 hypothetical protein G6F29_013090 [Rhizopus arrhizus]KAG0992726.1 hypothetical protein G6F28_007361 [Rhizopus arrhizus]KAG1006767.1 hypothetical protein G6F27_008000 [Rhizopus arrhizus]
MEERYMQANEIVMSELYMEEVVHEIDIDEDPTFTYGKLVLLADDRTMPQKADEDVVSEILYIAKVSYQ